MLQGLGLEFEVKAARVAEQPAAGETPLDFVRRAASDKAAAVAGTTRGAWVLAADTVVVLQKKILGKPEDEKEAMAVLQALAGRQHQVHTGFCLQNIAADVSLCRVVTTEVVFTHFSPAIAAAYAATGEPLDKAGAYGIQGCGGFMVERINGSYSNVVGLPLAEVVAEFLRYKVIAPREFSEK